MVDNSSCSNTNLHSDPDFGSCSVSIDSSSNQAKVTFNIWKNSTKIDTWVHLYNSTNGDNPSFESVCSSKQRIGYYCSLYVWNPPDQINNYYLTVNQLTTLNPNNNKLAWINNPLPTMCQTSCNSTLTSLFPS